MPNPPPYSLHICLSVLDDRFHVLFHRAVSMIPILGLRMGTHMKSGNTHAQGPSSRLAPPSSPPNVPHHHNKHKNP